MGYQQLAEELEQKTILEKHSSASADSREHGQQKNDGTAEIFQSDSSRLKKKKKSRG